MAGITVRNPLSGEILYNIAEPTDDEIRQVFATAQTAHANVSAMSVQERVAETLKLKRYIMERREQICDKVIRETGKSRLDALLTEIFPVIDLIDYYAKNAAKILADQKAPTPLILMGKKSYVCFEPIGPVLVISPWNYPFTLSFLPTLCAFLAGNSAILKPSKETPLKGVMEDIVKNSGFMPDAIQVFYGTREAATKLIDLKPAKIFFTGSVAAGKKIMAQASQHLIPVELELGGKDPMIVFDDVDLERTVNGALWGAFTNTGQSCTSVERVYVQESIYDQFVAMAKEKAARLSTFASKPDDQGDLDVGTMTTESQLTTLDEHLQDAIDKGATILAGGPRKPGSSIFPPTVLADANNSMKAVTDETFGPLLPIMKFSTEEEAIALANDSPYGLSASVWSKDLERAQRVARKIVTGNVSINNVMATEGNSGLPFGGVKDSGFGRYKGPYGLYTFSNVKSILVDKQSAKLEPNWYPYTKEKYAALSKLIDAAYSGGIMGLIRTAIVGMRLESLARKQRL
ncbi:MAG: aldehyde dehydrogenase family protein [Candidatus Hydrogenedentes bacterium]|nr:aldehyde dehydrogenase family protein [Candidatus Hydrogenedentota bacterium]